MDSTFWKSWPGVATITGLGVAAAAAVAYAVSKVTPAVTPTPGSGVTPGTPGATQTYYLFTLNTSYANTDAAGTTPGSAYAAVTAALTQGMGTAAAPTGFTQLHVEEDPFSTEPNGWIGTGLWTGTGAPALPPANGVFANLQVNNGSASSTTGLASLGAVPPAASTYGTAASPLVAGTWYTFTFGTSFISSGVAPYTATALAAVQALAYSMGWSQTGMLISPSSADNQKWNVVAQWAGSAAYGTQPAMPTSTQDRPPLVIYVPPVGAATTNPAPVAQSSQPTTVSST
jgi:hypothetical protein